MSECRKSGCIASPKSDGLCPRHLAERRRRQEAQRPTKLDRALARLPDEDAKTVEGGHRSEQDENVTGSHVSHEPERKPPAIKWRKAEPGRASVTFRHTDEK